MADYLSPEFKAAVDTVLNSAAICEDCPVRLLALNLDISSEPVNYSQFAALSLTQAVRALEVLQTNEPNLSPILSVSQQINITIATLNDAAHRVPTTRLAKALKGCVKLEEKRLPENLGS